MLYGYKIGGPRDWRKGHRFDSSIMLIDPYAKLVDGRRFFGDASRKLSKFYGTYDFDSLPFDWGDNYTPPNIPEVPNVACISVMYRIFVSHGIFLLQNEIRQLHAPLPLFLTGVE